MEQYIDKSALVAEIERLKETEGWCEVGKDTADVYYARGFRFACERIISFLNTLRPQNRWKPSDEQMETLELIINSHSLDAYHLGMVQHLYNGLKTLKE